MKIGILTLQLKTNYGCLLQAFALQKFLRNNNIDSVVISHYNNSSLKIKLLSAIKRFLLKLVGKSNLPIRGWLNKKEYEIISQNTERFINKNINRTEIINLQTDKEIIDKYNLSGIIVGSDQCWRPRTAKRIQKLFLENYTHKEIKRLSYAASFGTEDWEYDNQQEEDCKKLVQKFNAVSVREDSAVINCKEKFNIESTQVLDPTLLLTKEEYLELIDDKFNNNTSKQLMVYVLDQTKDKRSIIDHILKKYNLTENSVMPKSDYSQVGKKFIKDCIFPPVEEWIAGFNNCDYVVTDSFHGTVFAIIFNKPFISIANKNRGITRFTSLLKVFGLENRLVYSMEEITNDLLEESIDYNTVNQIRNSEIERSRNFLIKNLINE